MGSRREEEWVSLSEHEIGSKAQGGMLRDSSSEEHILGNAIKVTRTFEQSANRAD
jgi:hypothetical protein